MVCVAAVLAAVLAVVHGSAPAEGHSRTSSAASDGCPPGKRLGIVVESVDLPGVRQVAVQVAVQVGVVVAGQLAVFTAVQVGMVVDRKCDIGPPVGATMPSPDLLFSFWPFSSIDGAAVVLPLSPLFFAEPLVAGTFGFSLQDVGSFLTLAGGGMSLPLLRGTLAAVMCGALDDPAVAGTTVPGDLLAEVLGWDLESLALGEGQGEVKGRGQGGSLYYSPKKVCQIIVACCMLHNLALRRPVPFLQEDGPDGGLVAAVEPVDSEEEEAEEEDIDDRNNIIMQYFQ
ncbi:hypothetical protein NDU88_007810 [Pleurodeles waltl]|uniref:Nuclease HARBI1 n=1 Tax=Pleurodeles waltl TaxID=8319 RepID=A0AAV7NU79_PLEWA|nr:hypothetical protein NDU88_007810 [Pleurodeles waltl]